MKANTTMMDGAAQSPSRPFADVGGGDAADKVHGRVQFDTNTLASGIDRPIDEDGKASDATALTRVRLPIKQLTLFTRQMAMLMTSGSGVVPAISSIARQFPKPAHRQLMLRIVQDLEEGLTLVDALRKYPLAFDSTFCAIVAAGEATAQLGEMFDSLSKVVGKRRAMQNKIYGAMAYPGLLSMLCVGIITVMMFFVIPRFSIMFTTLSVPLPASTAFFIGTADLVRSHWPLFLIALLLCVGATTLGVVSSVGRKWISNVSTQLPFVGRVISGLIQGDTFRVLGMLVEARVGLLEAIDLVRGVTANGRFQQLYERMYTEVQSGGSISRAMDSSSLIAPTICHAVRTGEESGQLGGAMSYVADVLDEDNEELLNVATKLLEPLILIVMGIVVGAVAISLFLPLFDMTSAIS